MANSTSLEVQVTSIMTPYATSAYSAHSLVSTISVVQGVVNCEFPADECYGTEQDFQITRLLHIDMHFFGKPFRCIRFLTMILSACETNIGKISKINILIPQC